jgi:class 3 adenylate cyclase
MQDELRRYAEDVRHATGIVLQVRVGLDSGDVVVRSIGSDLRMDYSTVGQTTNVMEAVHRYSGTVNQVMGDGIMALFGAPLAHEDHAVRACFRSSESLGL